VPPTLLEELERRSYDQTPVYDEERKTYYGLASVAHLRNLWQTGASLQTDDPEIREEKSEFRVGTYTTMYEIVNRLRCQSALVVIQESNSTEYGLATWVLGLLTLADLNRHAMRSALYRLFSESETELARLIQEKMPDPWDWIRLLGEENQVRVLGYWELAKRRDVDVGPLATVTLTNLLQIVEKSNAMRSAFGYASRSKFGQDSGKVPHFRNRIMHPVRPLVLGHEDVEELYSVMLFLEKLRDKALENLKEMKAQPEGPGYGSQARRT